MPSAAGALAGRHGTARCRCPGPHMMMWVRGSSRQTENGSNRNEGAHRPVPHCAVGEKSRLRCHGAGRVSRRKVAHNRHTEMHFVRGYALRTRRSSRVGGRSGGSDRSKSANGGRADGNASSRSSRSASAGSALFSPSDNARNAAACFGCTAVPANRSSVRSSGRAMSSSIVSAVRIADHRWCRGLRSVASTSAGSFGTARLAQNSSPAA